MRYRDILEARKNPHLNKKKSALDELEKYRGQQDVFVSFTQDVGAASRDKTKGRSFLNYGVRSRGEDHNTSGAKLGINPQSNFSTPLAIYTYPIDYVLHNKGNVEYMDDAPFIQVVRAKDMSNMLDLSTEAGLEEYERIKETADDEILDALSDDKPHPEDYDNDEEYDDAIYSWGLELEEKKIESGKLSRLLASLLREQGYSGVIDYDFSKGYGGGHIHENEPSQAFFLSKSVLEHLETIHNIRPQDERTPIQVMAEKPKLFFAAMEKGNLSFEEILSVLQKNKYLFSKDKRKYFPMELIRMIKSDPVGIAKKYKPFDLHLASLEFTCDQQIDILKWDVDVFPMLVNPCLRAWEYAAKNITNPSNLPYSNAPRPIQDHIAEVAPEALMWSKFGEIPLDHFKKVLHHIPNSVINSVTDHMAPIATPNGPHFFSMPEGHQKWFLDTLKSSNRHLYETQLKRMVAKASHVNIQKLKRLLDPEDIDIIKTQ